MHWVCTDEVDKTCPQCGSFQYKTNHYLEGKPKTCQNCGYPVLKTNRCKHGSFRLSEGLYAGTVQCLDCLDSRFSSLASLYECL